LFRGGFVVGTLALAASFPSIALAGNQPSQNDSAVSQYIETYGTSTGNVALSAIKGEGLPLSSSAEQAIAHASPSEAKVLKTVATSPLLGAPTTSLAKSRSSISGLGIGSKSRPRGLLAVLLAITIGAVLLSVLRRRRT
jgi:hypothetical protein